MQTAVDQHIELDPDVRGGRARIAGTRVAVADIVIMHLRLGRSIAEIAGTYELTPASIHAALVCYYDHRADIDQSIDDDADFAEAFRRNNASPLQERLRAH